MKEFKVAHIVPVIHLNDIMDNQYHMCLAHLVGCEDYKQFYANAASHGKFVLMDNGAAEGSQLDFDKLFEMYEQIKPTEIVLPDTLYEPGSTIQKSRAFLLEMQDRGIRYRKMAVPQGRTLDEWAACARIMVKDTRVDSIGISKFLNIATRNKYVRFEASKILADLIREYNRYGLEVHLLGCDEGPLVVRMCHDTFPFVRGCDSAFSYLAAQANKKLTVADDSRPAGTIDFINGMYQPKTVISMQKFDMLAGVKDNGRDVTWF